MIISNLLINLVQTALHYFSPPTPQKDLGPDYYLAVLWPVGKDRKADLGTNLNFTEISWVSNVCSKPDPTWEARSEDGRPR